MSSTPFLRELAVGRARQRDRPWDLLVIGGGATGIAIAMDGASRGLEVLLAEQEDFGKGTSSRSTKLVHGGVRYLQQGNLTLVTDALRERALLRENAPHLVHDLAFLIPCRSWWQRFYFWFGMKLYDLLSTGRSFGGSRGVSLRTASELVPAISQRNLCGGVIYHDGQFDDARLLIEMATTANRQGACLINYAKVTGLLKGKDGRVTGAQVLDRETEQSWAVDAHCVINATGPFTDAVRALDQPAAAPLIAPSQGVHLVIPKKLFPGDTAVIVPKTSDGRVIFIIPWHDCAIVGTTDTPIPDVPLEPEAQDQEVEFLLRTASDYLANPITIDDVTSLFIGVRPLVKGDSSSHTASLSRDHLIQVADSGLITIAGGKWTTVRKMAEDCVDRAILESGLTAKPCVTKSLKLHGFQPPSETSVTPRGVYGSALSEIEKLEQESPDLAESLHPAVPLRKSEVLWAVRQEMARTVEDVLSRRTRTLIFNARAAIELAEPVARMLATELSHTEDWVQQQVESFSEIAQHYLPNRD